MPLKSDWSLQVPVVPPCVTGGEALSTWPWVASFLDSLSSPRTLLFVETVLGKWALAPLPTAPYSRLSPATRWLFQSTFQFYTRCSAPSWHPTDWSQATLLVHLHLYWIPPFQSQSDSAFATLILQLRLLPPGSHGSWCFAVDDLYCIDTGCRCWSNFPSPDDMP